MALYRYNAVTDNISISIVPYLIPERSAPELNQYFYGYKVIIDNFTFMDLRLVHRHFKIKNDERVYEIQGSGVVGNTPTIISGGQYIYEAFCPLKSPHGNMRGSFQFITPEGARVSAEIPLFFFRPDEVKE